MQLSARLDVKTGEFTDLYASFALFGVVQDVMAIELLLLFVLLVSLVFDWVWPTRPFLRAIGTALQIGAAPAFVVLMFLLGVSLFYFYLFGVTAEMFSALSMSYYSTLGLVLGQFEYEPEMGEKVGMLLTGVPVLIIRFVTFLVMMYLSCLFAFSLAQNRGSPSVSQTRVYPKASIKSIKSLKS